MNIPVLKKRSKGAVVFPAQFGSGSILYLETCVLEPTFCTSHFYVKKKNLDPIPQIMIVRARTESQSPNASAGGSIYHLVEHLLLVLNAYWFILTDSKNMMTKIGAETECKKECE